VHAYSSNPAMIDLFISKDGSHFRHSASLHPVYREGRQLFSIDPIGPSFGFIEIVVKETFGANRVYMNNVYLLEQHPKHGLSMKENVNSNKGVIEEQMNNYLKERYSSSASRKENPKPTVNFMPSEILKRGLSSGGSKDAFLSQDNFFSM